MNCGHDIDELILFHAEELDEETRSAVSVRLTDCSECQHELDRIAQFAAWQAQPVEFDMAALTEARARAYARIGGSWRVRLRRISGVVQASVQSLSPIPQLALALLLVFVGFSAGRLSSSSDTPNDPFQQADIRDIEIDAETGLATVRYDLQAETAVTGGLDNPSMRTVLQTAVGATQNAGTRLHALRTIGYLARATLPDSGLVGAVVEIIRNDENDALRLRAIRALDALFHDNPLPLPARSALLDLLVSSAGDGVRIAALEVLTGQDPSIRDLPRLRQASETDVNPYVRAGAAAALDRLESVPLESVQ
jgi:anti-sigma factor RsiW